MRFVALHCLVGCLMETSASVSSPSIWHLLQDKGGREKAEDEERRVEDGSWRMKGGCWLLEIGGE